MIFKLSNKQTKKRYGWYLRKPRTYIYKNIKYIFKTCTIRLLLQKRSFIRNIKDKQGTPEYHFAAGYLGQGINECQKLYLHTTWLNHHPSPWYQVWIYGCFQTTNHMWPIKGLAQLMVRVVCVHTNSERNLLTVLSGLSTLNNPLLIKFSRIFLLKKASGS